MSVFTNPASASKAQGATYTAALLELLGERLPLDVLSQTEVALRQKLHGRTAGKLTQAEAPGKWSVAQVLQHFADSDLVFGFRMRMILAHDRPEILGYDQDAWAERLRYDETDPAQAVDDFGVLRRANLRLIARCSPEELKRVGFHNERGEESIEHMMKLYAAHDLLHLRQIERILGAVKG